MKPFILFYLLLLPMFANAQTDYYWYDSQKIFFEKVNSKRFVLIDKDQDSSGFRKQFLNKSERLIQLREKNFISGIKPYKQKLFEVTKWAIVGSNNSNSLKGSNNIIYEAPYFKTHDNHEIGISHLFYVKLKKLADTLVLEKTASENNVEILGNNLYTPLWFSLACGRESKGNSMEMADAFYESGLFSAAEPDFISNFYTTCTTNDQYFNNQWNLYNTGQNDGIAGIDIKACDAWTQTKGDSSITVAVIDLGVQLDHLDLPNMSSLSYDTESGTSPSKVYFADVLYDQVYHGILCAGIIGAAHNSIGVSGIAPNCKIMSISNNLYSEYYDINESSKLANGFHFARVNGADVISNSWGGYTPLIQLNEQIDSALYQGRNGLGCVVVFSTGNDNAGVAYPANSNPDIIAVGAIDRCGVRAGKLDIVPDACDPWPFNGSPGSCYGSQLDIVAPGTNVPTTTIDSRYEQDFGGTSAACPHIAGIAALMLSVNSALTQKQVSDILESTAQKIRPDLYSYTTTNRRLNGSWNEYLGYGLANANACVTRVSDLCTGNIISNTTIYTDTYLSCCAAKDKSFQNATISGNALLDIPVHGMLSISGTFNAQLGTKLNIYPLNCGNGCTNPAACNYNASAIADDGSCVLPVLNCILCNDNGTWSLIDDDGDGKCNSKDWREDINNDGIVNGSDYLSLLGLFGIHCSCPEDINEDGIVNGSDYLSVLSKFGEIVS